MGFRNSGREHKGSHSREIRDPPGPLLEHQCSGGLRAGGLRVPGGLRAGGLRAGGLRTGGLRGTNLYHPFKHENHIELNLW